MPKPLSFGRLSVELTTGMPASTGTPQRDVPLRIGILGDFSGRTHRRASPPPPKLKDRRPLRVDRDNLDQVLQKAGIELQLPVLGPNNPCVRIRIAELDDFHPDNLFQRVEIFAAFRELRGRLSNPSTFAAAAAEVAHWASASTQRSPRGASAAPAPAHVEPHAPQPEDLLEQILGGTSPQPLSSGGPSGSADWQAVIQQIVQPYLVPTINTGEQAEMVARVDEAIGQSMRAILHHPDFQAVEAGWRAVQFLLRRLETDAQLQLFLLDISKADLAADLHSADDLRTTGMYRLLVDEAASQPWGMLAGLYTFDQGQEDVELLGRLAQIARQAGAPFLAAASSRLLGCASLAATPDPDDWRLAWEPAEQEVWAALRQLPEASYLGLALPRFLLRLPYGQESAPTEAFRLEEMPEGSPHEAYLWGSPAILGVYLLAQAFSQFGWKFRPGLLEEVEDLPVHIYREDGENRAKPCAEVVLGERALERMLRLGLMPVLSQPGRAAVRVASFRSLAEPTTPLAGRWG